MRIWRPCPPRPSRSTRLEMPNLASRCGFGALPSERRAEERAPGSCPSTADRRSRHRLPERRDRLRERAASPPAAGSACGVWSGDRACVCVKLEVESERRSSPSLSWFPKDGKGCDDFPRVEWVKTRTAQREHPQNRREAQNLPSVSLQHSRSAECGTVL